MLSSIVILISRSVGNGYHNQKKLKESQDGVGEQKTFSHLRRSSDDKNRE